MCCIIVFLLQKGYPLGEKRWQKADHQISSIIVISLQTGCQSAGLDALEMRRQKKADYQVCGTITNLL